MTPLAHGTSIELIHGLRQASPSESEATVPHANLRLPKVPSVQDVQPNEERTANQESRAGGTFKHNKTVKQKKIHNKDSRIITRECKTRESPSYAFLPLKYGRWQY